MGAKVVRGDINPPTATEPTDTPDLLFVQANVANWDELSLLFRKAKEHHGRIDCVFANAGIGSRANYLVIETIIRGT